MSRIRLNLFTIALDAMPWIAVVYAELMKLHDVPWRWTIVEGAAMNVKDTAWMNPQAPRLSNDGTTEFLDVLALHPRIKVIRNPSWNGKTEQCNAALATFESPGVLLQVDADEIWTAEQLRVIANLFEDDPMIGRAAFNCRYFVGPNITTTDEADWFRAWRFEIGDLFASHEPPAMKTERGRTETRHVTARLGLTFDHHSWTLPRQVMLKEGLYGPKYRGALTGWKRLQRHPMMPAAIRHFFPWSSPATMCDRVFK